MRLPNKAGFWTFRAEYTGLERTRAVRDNGDYYAGLHVETAHFYGGTKWVPVGSDDEAGEWIEWHGDRAFNDETKKVEDKTMGARIKAGLRDATEHNAAHGSALHHDRSRLAVVPDRQRPRCRVLCSEP